MEQTEQVEQEVIEQPDLTPETQAGGQDSPSPEADKPPQPPPERPWNRKPESIPYDRFAEVSRRRSDAEAEAAALRVRLAELEGRGKPEAQAEEPESLDPARFTDAAGNFDGAAYMRERDKLITQRAEKKALTRVDEILQQRQQQEAQSKYVSNLNSSFRSQVAEASKTNPEIAQAVDYLDSIAQHIPGPVQIALLRAHPEVSLAITIDPTLRNQLLQGDPQETIWMISEMHGEIKGRAPRGTQVPQPPFQGSVPVPPRTAPVPRTLSGGSAASSLAKLSQEEYNERRLRGEI